ncbi:hypothetical protein [Anaeromicropila herbilytica]|uniref:Uncharacterized protein n=1 Tax=Anaeromicropila herbilytica TaxID=2785025 RepID=A0A7R7EHF6_9FIRM|nr:hypothetical protein [Anaeromicropila herbilytica]BCN28809.1 hypothetical protein bsdtb5_01040 [Anaeromicropila herbilytica]
MSVNGVTSNTVSYSKNNSKETVKGSQNDKASVTTSNTASTAAVYEPTKKGTNNNDSTSLYKRDTTTIEKLKAEADRRTSQLRSLVEKMLLKQGKKFDESTDIYEFLRKGDYTVDEDVAKQAQDDISENGYWGVEQTSDRLLSFAKALTGGDPSKVSEMRDAVEKGFAAAKKAWGGELPSICKDTYDATMKKFDEWEKSSTTTSEDSSNSEA